MWRSLVPLVLFAATTQLMAEDWPQWMGPNRNGVWLEKGILDKIPAQGLKKLWSTPIQAGYSGPAVANGRVYVLDRCLAPNSQLPNNPFDGQANTNGTERILCLDAASGQLLWKHEYPCDYQVSFGLGPRCTPTVHDSNVYCLGTMGDLKCLHTKSGEVIWQVHCAADLQARTPQWGYCGHPLVFRNLLIALVGAPDGLIVALDRATGKVVWRAMKPVEPGLIGYSPPTLVQRGSSSLLLQFHPRGLSALNPETGKHLWTVPMVTKYDMSVMTPQIQGNYLFVAGFDCGVLLELRDGDKPKELWRCDQRDQGLHPINMSPLIHEQTIYGVDQPGMLRAVDLKTGKRKWQSYLPVLDKDYGEHFRGLNSGTAFLVRTEDRCFSFNECGSLHLMKFRPDSSPEMLGQANLVAPTATAFGRRVVWSHPAFAQKCIFVRNDQEITCYSLAK